MASGIMVFRSLGEAVRAGFEVYERTATGYIVRVRLNGRWQIAVVEC